MRYVVQLMAEEGLRGIDILHGTTVNMRQFFLGKQQLYVGTQK